jgi:hypothetical protein
MQKKTLILSLVIVFIFQNTTNLTAQDNGNAKGQLQIAFVPQYIIWHGMRLDFEYLSKNNKHSFMISPQFYYDTNELNYSNNPQNYDSYGEYEQLTGYGAGLHHKLFINDLDDKGWRFYFAYGGSYSHFTMNYKSWTWMKYTEDGLNYFDYQLVPVTQNTDRIKADAYIGFQFNYAENMFLDFYIGMGGIYSINKMSHESAKPIYTEHISDYAFTGFYMPLGFRFGLRF